MRTTLGRRSWPGRKDGVGAWAAAIVAAATLGLLIVVPGEAAGSSLAQASEALATTDVAPGTTQVFELTGADGTTYEITRESTSAGPGSTAPVEAATELAPEAGESEDAAVRCWIGKLTIRASTLNVHQYTWRHYVLWCGNGSRVTSYVTNASQNLATGTFWNWRGPGAWVEDIRGSSWRAGRQGRYELCYGSFCPQRMYPRHLGVYRGNGTWSTLAWSTYG